MNDTVFIPAVVAAYSGVSLDEKTPLHRAVQARSLRVHKGAFPDS